MATSLEIRTLQKAWLYDLVEAKKEGKNIDFLVRKMKASMEAEDFAYVEKIINEPIEE
jgi:hypothetical protein